MLGFLILLFIALPFAEIALLLRVGAWLGAPATFGLVILTGILGAALAKSQGAAVVHAIRTELSAGRIPVSRMVDGLLILAAGLLLITPGILSDIMGLLLLFPPSRSLFRRWVSARLRRMVESGHAQFTIMRGDGMPGRTSQETERRPDPGTGGRDVSDL